jgi:hypothetical protein
MIRLDTEQRVANYYYNNKVSIDTVKAYLIANHNIVAIAGNVYKVYGKKVLAIMHTLHKTQASASV